MVRWPHAIKEQGGPCHFVKTSAQPSGTAILELEAGESQCMERKKASVWIACTRACNLTVTYQRPRVENGPFFTSNCIHYIVLENGRISGMKINTIETKGMKFSWEVGAPATQWVPLCHKLFPLKWFHASFSAASAAMTSTVNNKTWETHSVLKFNILWCRHKQHISQGRPDEVQKE